MRVPIVLSLMIAGPAWAEDCETAYDMDALFEDLGASEEALRSKNYAASSKSAAAMRDKLSCLEQIMPVIIAGRAYRSIGAGLTLGGDDDGDKWMLTAAEVDPTFAYGVEDVPEGHPVRSLWKLALSEAGADPLEIEGKNLTDGKHFVDGKRINFPSATDERFHVYQWVQDGVHSFVIDGNAFPPEAFGEAVEAPAVEEVQPDPEPVTATEDLMSATVVKQKNWPGERVAMIVGGGAAVVGGGVMYGLSAGAHSRFEGSTTEVDMDKYKGQANAFFVGSGVSTVAGASAITFGALFFIIDGDPRPTLDFRF